jgi:hypothetical protein
MLDSRGNVLAATCNRSQHSPRGQQSLPIWTGVGAKGRHPQEGFGDDLEPDPLARMTFPHSGGGEGYVPSIPEAAAVTPVREPRVHRLFTSESV